MTNKRLPFLLFVALSAVRIFAQAQTPAPTPAPAPTKKTESAPASAPAYTLTELQRAHLREAQLLWYLANNQVQKAGEDFTRVCDGIKAENHWPDGTQCSLQDLRVIPPPAGPPLPPVNVPVPAEKK